MSNKFVLKERIVFCSCEKYNYFDSLQLVDSQEKYQLVRRIKLKSVELKIQKNKNFSI